MPISYPPRSTTELEAIVPEVLRVIGQSYAFFLWFTHVHPGLKESKPGYKLVVKNCLLEGTLLNLRKLDEFFNTGEKTKLDDARAYDFPGFVGTGRFLQPNGRTMIHKKTAHLTYNASRVEWNMATEMKAALSNSIPFLDYLINTFFACQPEKAELSISLRSLVPRVLDRIEQLAEFERILLECEQEFDAPDAAASM